MKHTHLNFGNKEIEMTLYFNTAVVKEGGQPTPVEEPWFEFNKCYNENDEKFYYYLHPVKAAKEWIKWDVVNDLKYTEGAVLESYEGNCYNADITMYKRDPQHGYEFFGVDEYHIARTRYFSYTYSINGGSTLSKSFASSYEDLGESGGTAVSEGNTCGYIQLYNDVTFVSFASRSEMPNWHEENYYPTWEYDVTWNEDGTFNLTNFKLVVDAEGNVYE